MTTRSESEDRRVSRTKARLRGAIAALVHEKPYDAIAVKQILARADVGRSAFYAHFRDKDALLLSAIEEQVRRGGPVAPPSGSDEADWVLRFARPLYDGIARARYAGGARAEGRRHDTLHVRVRQALARTVAEDLRRVVPGGVAPGARVPLELLARFVADGFLLVLEWWIASPDVPSAADAEAAFQALVRPAVRAAIAGAPPTPGR
ncbi:MAG TPA: TetR/AcrR family transcriptional regulator [Gemmatimonadaceae bacterium]|nr:TetR/AcrR family transcriptional regulator [Gemmatimonadaceae bacterium]